MKKSIFTIAFLVATGFVFAQEPETSKHAINTKGTGAANGRSITEPTVTEPQSSEFKIDTDEGESKSTIRAKQSEAKSNLKKSSSSKIEYEYKAQKADAPVNPENTNATTGEIEYQYKPQKAAATDKKDKPKSKESEVKFGWDLKTTSTR